MRCVFVVIVVLLAGCSESPMGRPQLALMPEEIMADMGREAFAGMLDAQPLADEVTSQRVQCISEHIIDVAGDLYPAAMKAGRWEVAVFENGVPNAFAMPGLRIGVFTGMLEITDNDAQLAAVLGHEVGHVLANHSNERMTQELGINLILLLVGFFSEIDSRLVYQVLGAGAHYGVTLPFSREHESEADLIGMNLMAAAGYDPSENPALWRNMGRVAGDQPLEFLSTHPNHESRIKRLEQHLPIARDLYESASPPPCRHRRP